MIKKTIFIIPIIIIIVVVALLIIARGKNAVTSITDKYVFSEVGNDEFIGEGFFVNLTNGKEYFIYSLPDDDPHKLENLRRRFFAISKSNQSFRYKSMKRNNIYLTTKYDLSAEHRLLSRYDYEYLAKLARERKNFRNNVNMVYQQDIEGSDLSIKILGSDIIRIDQIAMTSGGSAFYRTIHRKNGEPISIVTSTSRPNAKEILDDIVEQLASLFNTNKQITFLDVTYQHGVPEDFGWIVGFDKIYVESVKLKAAKELFDYQRPTGKCGTNQRYTTE